MKSLVYLTLVGLVLFEVCSAQSCDDQSLIDSHNETYEACQSNINCTYCVGLLNAGPPDGNNTNYMCCWSYAVLEQCDEVDECTGLALPLVLTEGTMPATTSGHSVTVATGWVGVWLMTFLTALCT